ncbi:MAG: GAF domain-containing protein, partial [Methyloprofundus sp.]|nr:GAF domain-containing protein [Methyloprofundus sp.]
MQTNIISLSSEYQVSAAQAEKLLTLQREILEKVALGVDYKQILDDLCTAAEAMVADAVASIMMFDASGEFLTVLAAPSIPNEAVIALNGLVPGEQAGSCGTAVYSGEAQFVVNTKKDQRWCTLQQFATDFGIGACWSCPVKVEQDKAIGSFALSSFEERVPSAFYKQLLETSAHIVGIIIKRQQEEKSLWDLAHYDTLTGLANRTLFNEKFAAGLKDAIINK